MPLRFRPESPPRPRGLLLRRDHARLFTLVAMVALVVIGIQQVRSPRGVEFLDAAFNGAQAALPDPDGAGLSSFDEAYRLDTDRLTDIQDNSAFRDAETPAWFYAWQTLAEDGNPAFATPASYTQLLNQPTVYRGVAVRVTGHVHRVQAVKPAKNDLGIETLFRIDLAPIGGEVWPVTLYTLDRPRGIPLGEIVRVPAQASGYFFKNQSYVWEEGLGITPVVLCKDVAVALPANPEENASPAEAAFNPWLLVASAALASVAIVGFVVAKAPPTRRRRVACRSSSPPTARDVEDSA